MLKTITLALLMSTAAGAAMAQDKWQGADDLPTNPLACDGTAGTVAAKPYDGGQPTNPPDLAGKEITVIDVPKLIGIGYFAATTKGQAEAAAELGKAMIDAMAQEIGEDGSFAIVTSTFTTPNQARWIAEMQAYQAACHPNMKWLETVEAQEDNNLSFNQASTLINKYGDELKGIFGMTSVATPASAEAVTQAGKCGSIAIVGLATPNAMKPYVEADCVKSVGLWNPVDLGYAAVHAMRAAVDGKLTPESKELEAGRLGKLQVVNGSEILLGPPFIYSKENINDFDF